MLRSLYTYKGSHARTLGFIANEKFLEIGSSVDINWVHVISERGALGFVPKNYVAVDQVPPDEMLDMIDACIEALHLTSSEKGGTFDSNEHEALQVLVGMRKEWHAKLPPTSHPIKRPAPLPPSRTSSQLSADQTSLPSPSQPPPQFPHNSSLSKEKREDSGIEETTSFIARGNSIVSDEGNECIHRNGSTGSSIEKQESSKLKKDQTQNENHLQFAGKVPTGFYRNIVEDIRANTNISYSTSHQVVSIVFKSLGGAFSSLNPLLNEILKENSSSDVKGMKHSCSWEQSGDGRQLVQVLEELRQCKDDDQQRSWALHEDEHILTTLLTKLIDILSNGDMKVCREVLTLEDHRPLLTLVQFYQMETRWPLRKLLLQIFAAVCQLSSGNISYLSSSILPLELTRVILHSKTAEEELQFTSLVLGMVLSMADTLPFTHFTIMNETFVEEILEGIESYSEYPETEGLAELYLTLILAFNLQSYTDLKEDEAENVVLSVLSGRKQTKYFIEKLLLLFNREEDPVAMFDHQPKPPHSVLCLMADIFSCPKTAQMLYTNDEKVVCDIILRQITDLAPDDQRRHDYLRLLKGVFVLGRWREYKHREKEFASRLASIVKEEDSPKDQQIIKFIFEHIPELIKTS